MHLPQYSKGNPVRIAVFYGEGASAVQGASSKLPQLDVKIHFAFSHIGESAGGTFFAQQSIPHREFDWQTHPGQGPAKRNIYFRKLLLAFDAYAETYGAVEYVILSGFMIIIPDFFIEALRVRGIRIINLHPAPLDALDTHGERKYVGVLGDIIPRMIADDCMVSCSCAHDVAPRESVDGGKRIAASGNYTLPLLGSGEPDWEELSRLTRVHDAEALLRALKKIIAARARNGA
jgi:folate-dependent phosphoribosylglycinamide formyltransferase PurN